MRASTLVAVGCSAAAGIATLHTAWNLRRLPRPAPASSPITERVSVLVPARNEARRLAGCLRALRATAGIAELEVLVLDDASTDGTAEVARQVFGDDPRCRVVAGSDGPPPGWTGKAWACAQLSQLATGAVLVFVDADVRVAPDGIAATVGALRTLGLDLVSPYPRQLADGPLPRLVQPLLQWSWATFLPMRVAHRSARPSLAAANGQLLACDAAAYRAAGGHAAVRDAVLDDVALLRALQRAGYRGGIVDGTGLAVCRMYDTGAELVDGYAKSLWSAFGSPAGAAAVAGSLAAMYVVPPVFALAGRSRGARWSGAAGYAAGVIGRVLVARRTGQCVSPDACAHPMSIAASAWLVDLSWRRRRRGLLRWRGRPLPD